MKAQLRLVSGSTPDFRSLATTDEQKYFAGYLKSTLRDFDRLGRHNRILCLKKDEYRDLCETVTQIGRSARSLGHKRLAVACISLAFLLEEKTVNQTREHHSMTIKDAFRLFIEMTAKVVEEADPTVSYIQRRKMEKASEHWDLLVIDPDEDYWIERQGSLLENCQPRYAGSGQNAMDILDRFQPDLVVLEAELGDMRSGEVIDFIKSTPGKEDIPVAMISQQDDSDLVVSGLVRGAFDFIPKDLPDLQIRDRLLVPLTVGRQRLYRA